MINEKDSIKTILEGRGVISDGVFDEVRFRKLVTEPWLYSKTIKYGFDKMNEKDKQVFDNEQVIEEQLVETAVEEPVVEAEEEPVVEAVEEPVVEAVEEPLFETDVEEPVVEAVEEPVVKEVVETPKKKTTKKK